MKGSPGVSLLLLLSSLKSVDDTVRLTDPVQVD